MSSSLRIEASRANGRKSRGSLTEDSKRASSANSATSSGLSFPRANPDPPKTRPGTRCSRKSIVLDDESAGKFASNRSLLEDEPNRLPASNKGSSRPWLPRSAGSRKQYPERYDRQSNRDHEVDDRPVAFAALAFHAMSDESRARKMIGRLDARYDRQYKSAIARFNAHRRASLKEPRREEKSAKSNAKKQIENAKRSEPDLW